jgi:DNA-binding MarR family transcriptional regulator
MEAIYPASGVQINYLEPLKDWRILDLKNLMAKVNYELGYVGFTKIISNLEKKNLVKSFRDPFSRKKYLYLTNIGNDYLGGNMNPPAISKETFVHDAKVVELVLEFLKLHSFYGFELEHQIKDLKSFGTSYRICPDAVMLGEKDGGKFKLAIELELTRKTKAKYLSKVGEYLNSSFYDFVVYFFQNKGVMNSYRTHIRDKYGLDSDRRILYVLNEQLLSKNFVFDDSVAFYKTKEGRVDELF